MNNLHMLYEEITSTILYEIFNFVVQTFFIWSHLEAQIIDIVSRSQFSVSRFGQYINFLSPRWLQMKKVWTTTNVALHATRYTIGHPSFSE
jgi:hypothetical protein